MALGLGGECEECNQELTSQHRASEGLNAASNVPADVHEALSSAGEPLDTATRNFAESSFGHNFTFSRVRVHTDSRAAESARSVNALAYTVGPHVVFGAGQYQPTTKEGKRLLAHELTHLVQQRNTGGPETKDVRVAQIPGQIAAKLRKIKNFKNFREIVNDRVLGKGWTKQNLNRMAKGHAPYHPPVTEGGPKQKYEINHKQALKHAGDVYDLDNLEIVAKPFHGEIGKD